MQYLLTEEEMDANRQRHAALERLPSVNKLQEFCTMVADSLILVHGWAKGRAWGCILTTKPQPYCDGCPAQDICPYPSKNWSK